MKTEARRTLIAFLIELGVYSCLVVVYFFLVLHLLGPSLANVDKRHISLYSLLCVGLILGQAILLEYVTTFLLRFIRGRSE
jgi:hypothetical protein